MEAGKKKLLFVITQPVVGGAQKYVFDLAWHFSRTGFYNVSIAAGGDLGGDLFSKTTGEGIRTHHLKSLSREVGLVGDLLAAFDLIKLFRLERPDVVHLNSSKVGFIGALAAFFCKFTTVSYQPKTIFTAHGWVFKEEMPTWKRIVLVMLARFSAKFQDRIICVSWDDFDAALKHRIASPRKMYVIHNAVGKVSFLPRVKARAEVARMVGRGFNEGAILLANPGRLYATKGLKYLIEAAAILKKLFLNRDVALVIFGDGPEREALQSQVLSSGLQGSVFFAGDVPEMSQYLKAFDALVLSSTKEGLPYSILEAGLAEVPIVSTDVGGIGEVIESGKTGFLVESKRPQALAEAAAFVLADSAAAKKSSRRLKKIVAQKFDFETMAGKTEWVYKV